MSEGRIRVTADDSEAQEVIARAEQQVEDLAARASTVTLGVTRSVSQAVTALNAVVNTGLSVLDIMGIAVDETLKAAIQMILSYAQQLALIATSSSLINPVYAAAVATVAVTINARAIQLQAAGAADAKAGLDKARSLMNQITQNIVIFTRR